MLTSFRTFFFTAILLCFSVAADAQTSNWQSSNGNTTTTDKVGIGTSTVPSSILELSAAAPVLTIRHTDPANYGSLYFLETTNLVGVLQFVGSTYAPFPSVQNALMLMNLRPGPEIFYTNSAERMRIDSAGKVGIGTATPSETLHVNGAVRVTGPTTQALPNSGSIDYLSGGTRIVGFGPDATTPATFRLVLKRSDGSDGWPGATPLKVNSSGRVGITLPDTTDPGEALQVNGAVKVTGTTATILANSTSLDYLAPGARLVSFGPNPTTPATFSMVLKSSDSSVGSVPFFVDALGRVGIGTTVPSQALEVAGLIYSSSASGGIKFHDLTVQSTAYPFSADTNTSDLSRPVAGLLTSSVTNANSSGSANLAALAGSGNAYVRLASAESTPTRDWRIGMTDSTGIFKIRNNVAGTDMMTISGSSIHFNGNVDGTTIQATYQDVAEWVAASETMSTGTVVVVGEEGNNTVTPSIRAYDTSVAGVVSANPGLLLGVASATKAKIATTGRVRVRVDATKSPIRKGDLLVTSDRPGMAMKSEPLDFGGVKLHRPGTLIGKALEPLPGGEGEILVLLSLQ